MSIGTPTFGNGGGASAAASFNVSFPSGIGEGDLLILACYTRSNNASAFSRPASFTGTVTGVTATANGSYAVYYKIATGTESGTLSVTGSTSNNTEVAKIVCIPGAGTSFTAGSAETEAAGTTFTNSGVTPATNGSMVVLVTGFQDHGTTTGDTGFSNWTGGTDLGTWSGSAYGTTAGTDGTIGIGCALQSTAQATGNISVDHTSETNNAGISYSFAVAPGAYRRTESESVTATDSYPVGKVLRGVDQAESATASDAYASRSSTDIYVVGSYSNSGTAGSYVEATVPAATWLTNDVLVATVCTNNNAADTNTVTSPSLTWTRRVNIYSASNGYSGIYTAVAGSDQVGSEAVRITDDDGTGGGRSIVVHVVRGADPAQTFTLTNTNSGTTSTDFSTTLTGATTSLHFASFHANRASGSATPNADSTEIYDVALGGASLEYHVINAVQQATQALGGTWSASPTGWRGSQIEVTKASTGSETSPYSRTQGETSTASDVLAASRTLRTQEQAESATATDDTAAGKVLRNQGQGESATATDSLAFIRVIPNQGQSESATATDTEVVTRVLRPEGQAETATATDDAAAGRVLRGVSALESASALDDYLSELISGFTVYDFDQAETATATDAEAASRYVRPQGQAESVTASESWDFAVVSAGVFTDDQAETATATEAWGVLQAYACTEAEVAAASDAYEFTLTHAATTYNEAQAEVATASDLYGGTTIAIIQQRLRLWNGSSWV